MMCGDRLATWSGFVALTSSRDTRLPRSMPWYMRRAIVSAGYRAGSYTEIRRRVRRECSLCLPPDLAHLLTRTLILNCTDPRDKVYALLGLAGNRDKLNIVPDYFLSLEQVYTDTMWRMIQISGRLDLLCFNANSHNPLPSWVPDWTLCSSRPGALWMRNVYRAAGQLVLTENGSTLYCRRQEDVLEVTGSFLDTVHVVSDVIDDADFYSPDDPARLQRLLQRLIDMVGKAIHDILPEQALAVEDYPRFLRVVALDPDPRNSDAFWRTLVANVTTTVDAVSMPAPAEFAEMFEILAYGSGSSKRRRSSQDFSHLNLEFSRLLTPQQSQVPFGFRPDLPQKDRIALYLQPLISALVKLQGRVLFVTKTGYIGIASAGVIAGDRVTIVLGSDMPLLLRRREESNHMRFISEAYVHDIMDGELMQGCEEEDYSRVFHDVYIV